MSSPGPDAYGDLPPLPPGLIIPDNPNQLLEAIGAAEVPMSSLRYDCADAFGRLACQFFCLRTFMAGNKFGYHEVATEDGDISVALRFGLSDSRVGSVDYVTINRRASDQFSRGIAHIDDYVVPQHYQTIAIRRTKIRMEPSGDRWERPEESGPLLTRMGDFLHVQTGEHYARPEPQVRQIVNSEYDLKHETRNAQELLAQLQLLDATTLLTGVSLQMLEEGR